MKLRYILVSLSLFSCALISTGQSPYNIELVKVKMEGRQVIDTLEAIPNGGHVFTGDERYLLRFIKDQKYNWSNLRYFTVLDLQPDNIINVLYPRPNENPANYKISQGDSSFMIPYSIISFAPPYGKESLVVIFTEEPLTLDLRNSHIRTTTKTISRTELDWLLSGTPPEFLKDRISLCRYSFEIRSKHQVNTPINGTSPILRSLGVKKSHTVLDRYSISNEEISTTYPDMFFISPPEPSYINTNRGATTRKLTSKGEAFVIKGQLRGQAQIESVDIFVNSLADSSKKSHYSTSSFKLSYRSKEFEQQVSLFQGENNITVVAYSDNGYGVSQSFTIESTPQIQEVTGQDFLLLMAINDYTFWPKLKNPINDASSIASTLQDHYGIEKENTITLFDEKCTPRNIDSIFRQLIKSLSPNDRLIVYFAGHGYYDMDFQTGYWIPVNGKRDQEDTWIDNDRIGKYIKHLPTRHTLFMSDACFSGSLYIDDQRSLAKDRHYEVLDKSRSRWMFSSGRMEEVADSYLNTNHSPFAWFILNYLDNPMDRTFSINDLATTVTKSVSNNSEQSPVARALKNAGDEGGEFVFHYLE